MQCRTSRNCWLAGLGLAIVGVGGLTRADSEDTVTAIGRLEPRGGPVRVAGPSVPVAVIAALDVEEGQTVTEGQVIARLDRYPNFYVDCAARTPDLTLLPSEKVRAFFAKYQDTIH